jgi:protein FRA10AC1
LDDYTRLTRSPRAFRFIRDTTTDPSQLSWEDNLALKYYNSLFREFAITNLKHYKSGQIALRWRTENEVLSGVGHLTCASMRCAHHAPLPERAAEFEDDPESEQPLVDVALHEYEVPFGYVEDGERRECLVKVVLCEEDGRRLMIGRRRAKRESEANEVARRDDAKERETAHERSKGTERSRGDRGSSSRPITSSSRRRSASPPRRRN